MSELYDRINQLAADGYALRSEFDAATLHKLTDMYRLVHSTETCTDLALGTFGPEIVKLRHDVQRLRARIDYLQTEEAKWRSTVC